MAKRNIHYIGFLANASGSIKGLKLGKGLVVEPIQNTDITPFLRKIEKHWGLLTSPPSSCCVVGPDIAQFEATPQRGVVIRPKVLNETHKFVQDKCRLLRLFKEGNIVLIYSFLYHLSDSDGQPKPFAFGREHPALDTTRFVLTPNEFSEAESFIQTVELPFAEPSLHLAFESLQQSYEVQDTRLAFLSLMIGMEAALGPEKGNTEITHQISRNAAILLGASSSESADIFRNMKTLYAKRSKIIHGAAIKRPKDQLQSEDMLRLRNYLRATIKILRAVSKPRKDILNHLNQCAFGSHPFASPGAS